MLLTLFTVSEETFYYCAVGSSLFDRSIKMQSNADVVLDVFRAVEQRDRDALFAAYDDDVEFVEARSLPYGGTFRGKDVLRQQLEATPERTWLGTWGPLQPTPAERRMDPRVIAAVGDEVAVAYTQRAVSPDGERFESPVLGLYEVRDGKFARAQMFHFDTAAILSFLERASSAHVGSGG
jgi:ketosteroid isomerase-like protein